MNLKSRPLWLLSRSSPNGESIVRPTRRTPMSCHPASDQIAYFLMVACLPTEVLQVKVQKHVIGLRNTCFRLYTCTMMGLLHGSCTGLVYSRRIYLRNCKPKGSRMSMTR